MEIIFAWLLDLVGSPVVRFADRLDSPAAAWLWLSALGCVVLFAFTPGLRLVAVGAVALLLVPSCVAARGEGWTYASFGTDTKGLNMSAQGLKADNQNQSKSIEHGAQAFKDVIRLKGMFSFGNAAIKELGDVSNDLIK